MLSRRRRRRARWRLRVFSTCAIWNLDSHASSAINLARADARDARRATRIERAIARWIARARSRRARSGETGARGATRRGGATALSGATVVGRGRARDDEATRARGGRRDR